MDTQGTEPGAFCSYDRQASRNEENLKKVAQLSRVERSLARRRAAARRFDDAAGPILGRFQCVVVAQQRFRPIGGGECTRANATGSVVLSLSVAPASPIVHRPHQHLRPSSAAAVIVLATLIGLACRRHGRFRRICLLSSSVGRCSSRRGRPGRRPDDARWVRIVAVRQRRGGHCIQSCVALL